MRRMKSVVFPQLPLGVVVSVLVPLPNKLILYMSLPRDEIVFSLKCQQQ